MANTGRRQGGNEGSQWTEGEARRVLAACARSGLSIRAFALREGLHPKRLYWWMRRLGLETVEAATLEGAALKSPAPRRKRRARSRSSFVPVIVKAASSNFAQAAIVIRRGGETTMEIEATAAVSPAWVAAVMMELERAACS